MREHARLDRRIEANAHFVQHGEQVCRGLDAIGDRIDADDRITRAVHEPIHNACGDAGGVIGRMIGLQPRGQPAG